MIIADIVCHWNYEFIWYTIIGKITNIINIRINMFIYVNCCLVCCFRRFVVRLYVMGIPGWEKQPSMVYKNSSIVGSIDNKCLSQFKATEKQLYLQLIFIVIVRTSNQDIPPHNNCGDANRMTIDPNDQLFYGIVIISETFPRIRIIKFVLN